MKKLFGLTGAAGCGKDTVASFMVSDHGVLPTSFAGPLKEAAMFLFGFTKEDLEDRAKKEAPLPYWGISPREILQRMGTEAMRNTFGDNFWLRRWFITYSQFKDTDDVVVSDVRFENEAEMIRSLGGTIIHIIRPANPYALSGGTAAHASAAGIQMSASDAVIINDGAIEDLKEAVNRIVTGRVSSKGGV